MLDTFKLHLVCFGMVYIDQERQIKTESGQNCNSVSSSKSFERIRKNGSGCLEFTGFSRHNLGFLGVQLIK